MRKAVRKTQIEFDRDERQLVEGRFKRPLSPRLFRLLDFLVANKGRVLTKEEIQAYVWDNVAVHSDSLKKAVAEVRALLRDNPSQPTFIETLSRRGYRFIGDLEIKDVSGSGVSTHPSQAWHQVAGDTKTQRVLVGRDSELEWLQRAATQAAAGSPSAVMLTGEPGIGKTALVSTFLDSLRGHYPSLVLRGHCLDHPILSEPYQPLYEALGTLCRGPEGREQEAQLAKVAPSWLLQVSNRVEPEDRRALGRQVAASGGNRMPRELFDFLLSLAKDKLVVIWIEDLHDADEATAALVAHFCRTMANAKLLFIGTVRPVEAQQKGQARAALFHELPAMGLIKEYRLGRLSEEGLAALLINRFATPELAQQLAPPLFERTGGNPLLAKALLDHWQANGDLVRVDGGWQLADGETGAPEAIPDNLNRLILSQFYRTTANEQALLHRLAACGRELPVGDLALILNCSGLETIGLANSIAQKTSFLLAPGNGDAEVSSLRFAHALYREIVYGNIPEEGRAQLHLEIGEALAARQSSMEESWPADLARHFELGGKPLEAARYLLSMAQTALLRALGREAAESADRAIALCAGQKGSDELLARTYLAKAVAASMHEGYASRQGDDAYQRALAHAMACQDPAIIGEAMFGLWTVHFLRGEIHAAVAISGQIAGAAAQAGDAEAQMLSELLQLSTRVQAGHLEKGVEHIEACLAAYDETRHGKHTLRHGADSGVIALGFGSWAYCLRGETDRARRCAIDAGALAHRLGYPVNRAVAAAFTAMHHQLCGEAELALGVAEEGMRLAESHDFARWGAICAVVAGWGLAKQGHYNEGIAMMVDTISGWRSAGAGLDLPRFQTLLGEAYLVSGDLEQSAIALEAALQAYQNNGEEFFLAETLRLSAALLQRQNAPANETEEELYRALDVAKSQGAVLFELRCSNDLVAHRRRYTTEQARLRELWHSLPLALRESDLHDVATARNLLESGRM